MYEAGNDGGWLSFVPVRGGGVVFFAAAVLSVLARVYWRLSSFWWAAGVPKQATRASDDKTRRVELQIEPGNLYGGRRRKKAAAAERSPIKTVKPANYTGV